MLNKTAARLAFDKTASAFVWDVIPSFLIAGWLIITQPTNALFYGVLFIVLTVVAAFLSWVLHYRRAKRDEESAWTGGRNSF